MSASAGSYGHFLRRRRDLRGYIPPLRCVFCCRQRARVAARQFKSGTEWQGTRKSEVGNHHTRCLSANLSCCCLCNLVFLQQPIIYKKCYGVLHLERLMSWNWRIQGLEKQNLYFTLSRFCLRALYLVSHILSRPTRASKAEPIRLCRVPSTDFISLGSSRRPRAPGDRIIHR